MAKLITVKIIKTENGAALVEFSEKNRPKRIVIPETEITPEDTITAEAAAAGIPYGLEWEKIKIEINPEKIADELRNNGIWTADDLYKKPEVALAALRNGIGLAFGNLIEFASKGV